MATTYFVTNGIYQAEGDMQDILAQLCKIWFDDDNDGRLTYTIKGYKQVHAHSYRMDETGKDGFTHDERRRDAERHVFNNICIGTNYRVYKRD